jgi:hypothetical protein
MLEEWNDGVLEKKVAGDAVTKGGDRRYFEANGTGGRGHTLQTGAKAGMICARNG